MKISSGLLGGHVLRSPVNDKTRPSSGRLRQAIFNVLRHYHFGDSDLILEQAVVADVFAGSGAWGLEAVSNGARECIFVESDPKAAKVLRVNMDTALRAYEVQNLAPPALNLLTLDVERAYPKLPVCRVIFCDPPYREGWFTRMIELEEKCHRVGPGGLFVFESLKGDQPGPQTPTLRRFDEKIYGDSAVHFFIKKGDV